MRTQISATSLDKHKSVLIIGIAATNKYLNTIVQSDKLDKIQLSFGDCNLTTSYKIITDMVGTENIYLLNIENLSGLLELSNTIASYNFAYIVPIDLNISDYFNDVTQNMRRVYYFQYLLQSLYRNLSLGSTIIVTDAHASLYETIDDFLDDMAAKRTSLNSVKMSTDFFSNVIFVYNNLSKVPYSNVVLAGMIVGTNPNEYPSTTKSFSSIFHIDYTDNIFDIAYFQTHPNNTTTIENLLTLLPSNAPEKVFTTYRICLYIDKELDYSSFAGTRYTAYKKYQIENLIDRYLASITNYLITDYNILSVTAYLDPDRTGCVKIKAKYEIYPINSAERGIIQVAEFM